MKAFYFAKPNERLAYGDDRPIELGETHFVKGTPSICSHGLHASVRVFDALQYASSSILYSVEVEGDIDTGADKICGSRRTYLKRCDIESVLRDFAKRQALINIEKIKPYCSESDYFTIMQYLGGDNGLHSAAYSVAHSAAHSAAHSLDLAAQSAAHSVVYSTYSAAHSVVHSTHAAVQSAAYSVQSAAHSAAYSTYLAAASLLLTQMVAEYTGWDMPDA